jgi:glycosyltransferase involved in cell wall biosynthesis
MTSDLKNSFNVTLVITTFNRAALLRRALESVSRLTTPAGCKAELIVVDNNSTDTTCEVAQDLGSLVPNLEARYVFEASQGLSSARNRALREARGSYIAFMDDDQEIDSAYVENLERAFAETQADCVGGKIVYKNARNLPEWLEPLIADVGQLDLGDQVCFIDGHRTVLKGGNIAFRRAALESLGGFDTRLGRTRNQLVGGEENDLQGRILANQGRVAYHPKLVQYNWLLPEKLSKTYWRRRAFDYGRTKVRLSRKRVLGKRFFLGVPLWMYREIGSLIWIWLEKLVWGPRAERFPRELKVWESLGTAVASRSKRARSSDGVSTTGQ